MLRDDVRARGFVEFHVESGKLNVIFMGFAGYFHLWWLGAGLFWSDLGGFRGRVVVKSGVLVLIRWLFG
jgi:hypothetical protein